MNIYIIRHGKTFLNMMQKNQGWIDSDLTNDGIEELKENIKEINLPEFDKIYCSDLGRTRKTLDIILEQSNINSKDNIEYTTNLRERFLGSFEGDYLNENREIISKKEGYESFKKFMLKNTFWDLVDATKKHDPQNLAENFAEFSGRIDIEISNIINNNDNNVLIVSHSNTVKYIIQKLTNNFGDFDIPNGKIFKLIKNIDGNWSIE